MALSRVSSISGGDLIVLDKTDQGDFRTISFTDLLAEIEANISMGRPEADSQYASPSATGFSVSINSGNKDVHLILTPVAGYANGTIVLPLASGCRDKQEVSVNCTQAVTTLAITANGALAVTGAPTTLAAFAFFKLCYDLASSTWYRVD
jgi:hypothetical protein